MKKDEAFETWFKTYRDKQPDGVSITWAATVNRMQLAFEAGQASMKPAIELVGVISEKNKTIDVLQAENQRLKQELDLLNDDSTPTVAYMYAKAESEKEIKKLKELLSRARVFVNLYHSELDAPRYRDRLDRVLADYEAIGGNK